MAVVGSAQQLNQALALPVSQLSGMKTLKTKGNMACSKAWLIFKKPTKSHDTAFYLLNRIK